jgi:Kef-type K+ transport system membrane component KefB
MLTLLASSAGGATPYGFLILLSILIILSFFFNKLSEQTKIPSVVMLIGTGVILQYLAKAYHFELGNLDFSLEVLGKVGLVMIVLEAALDLELKKEKIAMIGRSLISGLLGVVLSSFAIAFVIYYFANMNQPEEVMTNLQALIYATPLGILSSAIIIPSVGSLRDDKKEWMIYESTFSDILGIIFFYFLLDIDGKGEFSSAAYGFGGSVILTIVASFVLSYLLVMLFQRITGHVKLFVMIAVLMLLYFTGSYYHLSPLWIILIFGLVLANPGIFFRGPLSQLINTKRIAEIDKDFSTLTVEFAFVIRTFFFVEFGLSLGLETLLSAEVWLISILAIALIYGTRWITLKLTRWKDFSPELFIAPRGLITVLLFYAIPDSLIAIGPEGEELFSSGIILTVILLTSGTMTAALINHKEEPQESAEETEDELPEGETAAITEKGSESTEAEATDSADSNSETDSPNTERDSERDSEKEEGRERDGSAAESEETKETDDSGEEEQDKKDEA